MNHLLKGELSRFKWPALLLFIVHLSILKYASMIDLFKLTRADMHIGTIVYAGIGCLLAYQQFSGYRRPNQWTYLIHKPLATWQICLSIVGAGLLLLFMTVALPFLGITLYLDIISPQWVDTRAYLLIPYLWGLSATFYLGVCFALLNPHKLSFMALGLAILFLTREAATSLLFVIEALCVAFLLLLVVFYFKPNLSVQPKSLSRQGLSAIPIALGVHWFLSLSLLLTYSFLASVETSGWRSFAAHAWNDYFKPGTYQYVDYQTPQNAILHGLRNHDEKTRAYYTQQLKLVKAIELKPTKNRSQSVYQLPFLDNKTTIIDQENEIQWKFQYDALAFQGMNLRTKQEAGWLTLEGDRGALQSIPSVIGGHFVAVDQSLYRLSPTRSSLTLKMTLDEGDYFRSVLEGDEQVHALLSNEKLHLFTRRSLRQNRGELEPALISEIPLDSSRLSSVQIAQLIDGYLVSFVYQEYADTGYIPAHQVLRYLPYVGDEITLSSEVLESGVVEWSQYREFLLSPAISLLKNAYQSALDPNYPALYQFSGREISHSIYAIALFLALFSSIVTALETRRRALPLSEQLFWVLMALIFSTPLLFTYLFMIPRPELGFFRGKAPEEPKLTAVMAT